MRHVHSAADSRLAGSWHAAGVALDDVEQAILLGCGRKYVSWLNGGGGEPIGSLNYFVPILQEVQQNSLSAQYREFNRIQVGKLEKRWLASRSATVDGGQAEPLAKSLRKRGAPVQGETR